MVSLLLGHGGASGWEATATGKTASPPEAPRRRGPPCHSAKQQGRPGGAGRGNVGRTLRSARSQERQRTGRAGSGWANLHYFLAVGGRLPWLSGPQVWGDGGWGGAGSQSPIEDTQGSRGLWSGQLGHIKVQCRDSFPSSGVWPSLEGEAGESPPGQQGLSNVKASETQKIKGHDEHTFKPSPWNQMTG